MTSDPNFKFDITVSEKSYKSKPTSVDYCQMKWYQKKTSLRNFISMVMAGYSYCHIYYRNLRRKDKFLYTQIISIDVDNTDTELKDFYPRCQLKPTFAYETFSNGVNDKFSYRLVYVFKEKIKVRAFEQIYDKICRMTGLSDTKDHCGRRPAQLMNGTNSTAKVFCSNFIYSSVSDLPVEETESEYFERYKDSLIPPRVPNPGLTTYKPNPSPAVFRPSNNSIRSIKQKQYMSNDPLWKKQLEDISEPLRFLKNDREGFLVHYGKFLQLIRWSKLAYNDAGYCVIPEDHLSLFVRYNNRNGECSVSRFRDGEKRRNRLFIDGCIIRKIKPEITFLELFFNLVHRVYYYYDNSDGVLSDELIARKAYDVMNYTEFDSMQFVSLLAGRITTSPGYCRNHGISRRAYSRRALMYENYASIQEWYDPALSVCSNIKEAQKRGLDVSLSTLRRYCKFNGIPTNPMRRDISEWYDPALSVKQNLAIAFT